MCTAQIQIWRRMDNARKAYNVMHLPHGTISRPRLRALPTTDLETRSSPKTLSSSSAILIFTISYICLTEIFPTKPVPAAPPLPAAAGAGGAPVPAVDPVDEFLLFRIDNDGGVCEPFSMPAQCRRRCETGGVRMVNENVRSGLIVIVVGVGVVGFK
jgi:hypothetical protein